MHRLNRLTRMIFWTAAAACIVLPSRAQTSAELPLGSKLPMADLALDDVNGGQTSLAELRGENGIVVVFWSNQCPWVAKYEGRFKAIVSDFSGRGLGFALVNSNDATAYPQEAADKSANRYSQAQYPAALTYLSDPQSQLARAFGAERTPHVYVFNADDALVYVGTIDDSPGDPSNVKDQYLRDALNAVLGGSSVSVPKTKAFGCTIKFAS